MSVAAADFNENGWVDLYIACDSTASILYHNNHDSTFTDVALESGAAYNEDGNPQAGMGLGIGDYDRDGRLDIFKTHFADDTHVLYRNLGSKNGVPMFEDATIVAGFGSATQYVSWGAGMPDLDNDGWPEIFYVTGSVYPEVEKYFKQYAYRGPRLLFHNLGNRRFQNVTSQAGPAVNELHTSRGCAFGEFDNDGDVDILIMNMNEPPSLLRNDYAGVNHWLKVKTVGVKSNRSGLGARVVVTAAPTDRCRPCSAKPATTHTMICDSILVWARAGRLTESKSIGRVGQVDVLKDVTANQLITVARR
jgi:hypothetical protein